MEGNQALLVELLKKHKLPTQGITITLLGATLAGKSLLCKAIIIDFFQRYYPWLFYCTFSCSSDSEALNGIKDASNAFFPIINGGPQKEPLNKVYQMVKNFNRGVESPDIVDATPNTKAGAVVLLDDMQEKDSRGSVVQSLMLHKRNANFSTILTSHDRALATPKMRGNILVVILMRFNQAEGIRRVCDAFLVDKLDNVKKGDRYEALIELYDDITRNRGGFIFSYASEAPYAIYGGNQYPLQELYETFYVYSLADRLEKRQKMEAKAKKIRERSVDLDDLAARE